MGQVIPVVSQPLAAFPSQFEKPVRQAPTPQAPAVQVKVSPVPTLQRRPHAPQLRGALDRSVSQPLAASPSQSSRPGPQTRTHLPALQVGAEVVPMAPHARSHPPQLVGEVAVFVSQPLSERPSQSSVPMGQRGSRHAPKLQVPSSGHTTLSSMVPSQSASDPSHTSVAIGERSRSASSQSPPRLT